MVRRRRGTVAVAAPPPELPWELAHLWTAFLQLNQARGSNGFGPSALSFCEIEAWTRLMRWELRPWEVETLQRLDASFLADWGEQQKREQQKRGNGR